MNVTHIFFGTVCQRRCYCTASFLFVRFKMAFSSFDTHSCRRHLHIDTYHTLFQHQRIHTEWYRFISFVIHEAAVLILSQQFLMYSNLFNVEHCLLSLSRVIFIYIQLRSVATSFAFFFFFSLIECWNGMQMTQKKSNETKVLYKRQKKKVFPHLPSIWHNFGNSFCSVIHKSV